MRAFLSSWQRKWGCGVLCVALLFCGAWGVSNHFCVIANRDYGDWRYHFHSYGNELGIWWYRPNGGPRSHHIEWHVRWHNIRSWKYLGSLLKAEHNMLSHRFRGRFTPDADGNSGPSDFKDFSVPYWGLVLPLTVLSACLFFWPRRWAGFAALPASQQPVVSLSPLLADAATAKEES